ncbi:MAG: exodeoxyribonuclease VII small subunit [Pseudomonadota bacterium]
MAKTNQQTAAEPTLDETLAELEALVEKMESGDLSLDEAMREFERGIELTRRCQKVLSDAEQKFDILLKKTAASETVETYDTD